MCISLAIDAIIFTHFIIRKDASRRSEMQMQLCDASNEGVKR